MPLRSLLRAHEGGWTLVELLGWVCVLSGVLSCAALGCKWGAAHGTWIRIGCGVLGAIIGGAAGYSLIVVPLWLCGAIGRVLEPADLVCRCRLGDSAPAHLTPNTGIEITAVAESRRLAEWPELARIRQREPDSEAGLRARLASAPEFSERIALAAQLGDAAARAVGIARSTPVLHFADSRRLPKSLREVLRSGLPPRLYFVWALLCTERVLPAFEREFHQDTRPRQALGAAALLLREGRHEALELCRTRLEFWYPSDADCRVLHRDLWTRIRGSLSQGMESFWAFKELARLAADFIEPRALWAKYSPGHIANAYETPRNRCMWSHPRFHAEEVAYHAARASGALEDEYQWQRAELARMILGWERWVEDRAEWQRRVEEEWIPRVLYELEGWGLFNVSAYAERIREEFLPWRRVGKSGDGGNPGTVTDLSCE